MSTTITVQVVGHLTHDVELRHTATGTPVASIRLAVTPRRPTGTGGFENGETSYLSGSAFGPTAEHVAASLKAGCRRRDRPDTAVRATATVTRAARSSTDETEDASS
jgi:single-strand DNA-binding protein